MPPSVGLVVPRNQVTCLSVSTDGSVLLSGSHDETVRLWDVQSKQCIRTVTLKGEAPWVRGHGAASSSGGSRGRAASPVCPHHGFSPASWPPRGLCSEERPGVRAVPLLDS